MRPSSRSVAAAAALALLLAALPAAALAHRRASSSPATATTANELHPTDYTEVQGLSQPSYAPIVEGYRVPMPDGEELHVEISRPDPARYGDGPWPVILEASPYHGTLADRQGLRIYPDPMNDKDEQEGLTGYFAPRGYAVAMVDLRGTGRSSGCLDHLGQNDAKDLKTVVEWLAHPDRPWSAGEWNRVGMTGHSYVGSTPSLAAAQRPRGLATIVPSAGLASMYDHQFQYGVPYLLQYTGVQWTYAHLSTVRKLPPGSDPVAPWGDDFGNRPEETGCGYTTSALTAGPGQVTGAYEAWHAQRDWRDGAAAADIPVFMVHGVNDNAARIPGAEWFFGRRFGRTGDKVWLGQWDHGAAGATACSSAHPNCRFEQWQYALHAWFDKHLQQRDVDTGPPVEVFLNDGTVLTAPAWQAPSSFVTLHPDANGGTLGRTAPDEPGAASFTAVGGEGAVEFTMPPVGRDLLVTGLPRLRLVASVTSQPVYLVAALERVDADGGRHPMTYCAIQPQLRYDVRTPAPVVPGQPMELAPQCFTMAHRVPAGDSLVLTVRTTSPHHVPVWSSDAEITVYTGAGQSRIALPVMDATGRFPDPLGDGAQCPPRPIGEAQVGVAGSTPVVGPSPFVLVYGVTAATVEFDIEDGYDNDLLEAVAEPSPPADLDLYLQAWDAEEEAWGDTVASAATRGEEPEVLQADCPRPGRYRLVIHDHLGPPTDASYTITFRNQAGTPGPPPAAG